MDSNIDGYQSFGRFRHAGRSFEVGCLTTIEAVGAIADSWRALERKNTGKLAGFQSFNWCWTWLQTAWKYESADCELAVMVLREGETTLAVWPLMSRKRSGLIRELVALGEPHSQYANWLCDHDLVSEKIARQFVKRTIRRINGDVMVLNCYLEGSLLDQAVERPAARAFSPRIAAIQSLGGFATSEDWSASFDKKTRKNRRFRRNKLAKQGEVTCEAHPGGTEEYKAMVDKALGFKRDWLQASGRRQSVISDPATAKFLKALTAIQSEEGFIDGAFALVVKCGGEPVAIEISYAEGGHVYSYLGAFDWQWRAYSVGKIQIEMALAWAIDQGYHSYDFLGEPADYKAHWSNLQVNLRSGGIALTFKGVLYSRLWVTTLYPAIRAIFDRLSPDRRNKLLSAFGFGTTSPRTGPKELATKLNN